MKRLNTKKTTTNIKRRTQKRRDHSVGGDGNNYVDSYYYMVSESETRPGYPVVRVIHMPGHGAGGLFQFEKYLSDLTYDIEDSLAALELNRQGKRLPKQARIKKYVVKRPFYNPPPMI